MACGLCSGLRTGRMAQTAQTFSDHKFSKERPEFVFRVAVVMHFTHQLHAHSSRARQNQPSSCCPIPYPDSFPSLLAPNFNFSHDGLPSGLQKETEFRFIYSFKRSPHFCCAFFDFPGGSDSKASAYKCRDLVQLKIP